MNALDRTIEPDGPNLDPSGLKVTELDDWAGRLKSKPDGSNLSPSSLKGRTDGSKVGQHFFRLVQLQLGRTVRQGEKR